MDFAYLYSFCVHYMKLWGFFGGGFWFACTKAEIPCIVSFFVSGSHTYWEDLCVIAGLPLHMDHNTWKDL